MALYLNTDDLNIYEYINKISNLLDNGYVINHISLKRYLFNNNEINLIENKEIDKDKISLKAQFLKNNDNTYSFKKFNCYGNKVSDEIFKNKRLFKLFFIKHYNGKLFPLRFNKFRKFTKEEKKEIYFKESNYENIFSYHKQRISKKITSNDFVSNELDIKIEVYKFLYNKNPKSIIIPELTFNNRRVDFISFDDNKINTTMIEIKSSLDNFDRLHGQLETYSKIGNLIYLAIDINKYNELLKKQIILDNHIGIIIFDNSKKQKLKIIKKAIKINQNNDNIYQKYLSYNDYLDGFRSFKLNSKISKENKEYILLNKIDKSISNKFSYDVLKNRHIIESDLRKDFFHNNNYEKAVASAKELKINRFDSNGKYMISLLDYINNKNIIYDFYIPYI